MTLATAPSASTPARARTLHGVVRRILPGIEGPGAADTEAAVAVERAMQHQSLRGMRRGIEQLLDRLHAQALERHGVEFSDCTAEVQDEMLGSLERDTNPWARFLFRSVIALSLQGLLGDPVHGGNRDCRGWDAIGLRAADVRSGLCRGPRDV